MYNRRESAQITTGSSLVPRTTPKYGPFCCASILSQSLNALKSRNLSCGNLYRTKSLQQRCTNELTINDEFSCCLTKCFQQASPRSQNVSRKTSENCRSKFFSSLTTLNDQSMMSKQWMCISQTTQIIQTFTNPDYINIIIDGIFWPISSVVIIILVMSRQLVGACFIAKQAQICQCRKTRLQDTQQPIQVLYVKSHSQVTTHLLSSCKLIS